jgi:predicted amidophosphoribosyltransferase
LPVGPVIQGGSFERPRESTEPEHNTGHCKRCGKETELDEGLCTECKWEIEVGLVHPPPEQEKKHHFWSLKR